MRAFWQRSAPVTAVVLSLFALGAPGSPARAADASGVLINEVESSGGSPGDWVEIINRGSAPVNVSGWIIKDNDASHSYAIASGTTLAVGARLALDVESSFGLGSSDSARLYRADGTTLVDSYTWTSHASTSYGRCADGAGGFVTTGSVTKGAANVCPAETWPGGSAVAVADGTNVFGTNLSGLSFEGSGVLWAVNNGPSKLYRLVPSGSTWVRDTAGGWSSGRTLNYLGGSGDPDAEGVVSTPDGLFVATERDNDSSGTSKQKILKFDTSGSATSLNATAEWNLTADLPSSAANSGIEGISYIPDAHLTAHGFRDEHTGAAYSPASYPGHGGGLFLVGLEANGSIYAYALTSGGTFTRVATVASGLPAVMDLEFDPATGHLWAACDDTCGGKSSVLDVNAQGAPAVTHIYNRPSGLSDYNHEGFAISPACAAGHKQVVWADDSNDGGHALRAGTLDCT